jgi:hypothetical protein
MPSDSEYPPFNIVDLKLIQKQILPILKPIAVLIIALYNEFNALLYRQRDARGAILKREPASNSLRSHISKKEHTSVVFIQLRIHKSLSIIYSMANGLEDQKSLRLKQNNS